MTNKTTILAPLAALLLASCNRAEPPPDIAIGSAWARPTVAGQAAGAAYFTIRNSGGADRLLSVESPAGAASLHSTGLDNGIARMRPLDGLDIAAKSTVELKPGGAHVMLMGLKQPLATGSSFPLEARFERSGVKHVMVEVRPALEGAQ